MSLTTFKAGIDTDIIQKQGIPQSVPATRLGQAYKDLSDEVAGLFSALYGGTLPADLDTLTEITTKLTAMNNILGVSGKTIDQLNTDIQARELPATVDSKITTAINNLIGGAPGALNALNELATAMGNDPNFATTMTNALATKEPSIGAKGTAFNKNYGTTAGTTAEGNHTHNTDALTEGSTNKWWTNARTISAVVTGYVKAGTASALAATDTISQMFGKLEKYIENIFTALGNKANLEAGTGTIPLSELPTIPLSKMEQADLIDSFDLREVYEYNDGVWKLGFEGISNGLRFLQDMGIAIKGETYFTPFDDSFGSSMASGSTRFAWVKINKQTTLSDVLFAVRTAGVFTASGNNVVGFHKVTAGNATLVAQTADIANDLKSVGIKRIPFLTPYVADPGYYLMSIRYESSAQTNAPTLMAKSLDTSSIINFEGIKFGFTSNTNLPATLDVSATTSVQAYATLNWFGYN